MNFDSSDFCFGARTYLFFALFDAEKALIVLDFCSKEIVLMYLFQYIVTNVKEHNYY